MENKAQVSERHRLEWRRFRNDFIEPDFKGLDEKDAKAVKLLADILKIYQEGERKAYGFADGEVDQELSIGWESAGEQGS